MGKITIKNSEIGEINDKTADITLINDGVEILVPGGGSVSQADGWLVIFPHRGEVRVKTKREDG